MKGQKSIECGELGYQIDSTIKTFPDVGSRWHLELAAPKPGADLVWKHRSLKSKLTPEIRLFHSILPLQPHRRFAIALYLWPQCRTLPCLQLRLEMNQDSPLISSANCHAYTCSVRQINNTLHERYLQILTPPTCLQLTLQMSYVRDLRRKLPLC